jgi:hypothetical protein
MVVEIEKGSAVNLNGKVKFSRGCVVFAGDKETAIKIIQERYPDKPVVYGTATAGEYGTATAGDAGTATAGDSGTATAGDRGEIRIRWYDGRRYRLAVGYVGEEGIEANTAYRVVDGKLVKA